MAGAERARDLSAVPHLPMDTVPAVCAFVMFLKKRVCVHMCVQHPGLQMWEKYSSQSLPHLRRVLRRLSSDQGVQHRVALAGQ